MNNNFLIICDLSYWTYFVLFGSVSDFQKNYPDEAALWIKPLSECDQENLPNLLNCNTFTKILRKYVMKEECMKLVEATTMVNIFTQISQQVMFCMTICKKCTNNSWV